MGVMACDRNNCNRIMCDRIILGNTKYICNKCWSELMELRDNLPNETTEAELVQMIRQFMDSPASKCGKSKLVGNEVLEVFDGLVQRRNNEPGIR